MAQRIWIRPVPCLPVSPTTIPRSLTSNVTSHNQSQMKRFSPSGLGLSPVSHTTKTFHGHWLVT